MLYRIFLVIKNKYIQSFIAIILSVLILSFEFATLLLYKSANITKNNIMREIGVTLNISPNDEYLYSLMEDEFNSLGQPDSYAFSGNGLLEIDMNLKKEIESLNHVVGSDYTIDYFMFPLNFDNVKEYTGCNPDTQNDMADGDVNWQLYKDCISVTGSYAINELSLFRRKQNKLIDGTVPSIEKPGALISDLLAEKNNLSIGENLNLAYILDNGQNDEKNNTVPIVGIYHSDIEFEVLDSNFYGSGVFSYSPYNKVYVDYETACLMANKDTTLYYLDVYIDSPENIKSIGTAISNLPSFDSKKLQIDNYNNVFYNTYAWQLDGLIKNLSKFIVAIMILGIIIYLFVLSFWYRDHLYDIGLLIALGENKKRISLQKLTETIAISMISLPISILLGTFISFLFAKLTKLEFISDNAINTVQAFITNEHNYSMALSINVDIYSVLLLVALALILSFLSALIPIFTLIHYNSREIFSSNE
ncbi:ABC transporter permease [Ruminococcus sp.]|uniref:ABC transporter permease n=1 Tax=Ruminococcus sp. TaxID=41978 RepID=UPI002E78AF42|nr:FtsX-like permease family protein [Ruminococcus sp.]MEE0023275.1 FtsX-like permease family protein [Ruminococcus sp.]